MPLRFLLLAGHLADYVAKLALLLRLAREPSLRAHFIALAVVHVAANVHGAYAVIRGCGLPRFAVLPIVLVFGVVTPLLQVLLLFDAVLALRTRSQGAGSRAGGRALHLPLAPLDVVLEGSVFVLATLHIHFSRVLGRVDLLSETHSDDVGGLDLLPGMPGWPGLPGNHAFLGSQVFEALLVSAMVTSLANATSGFVLWDASVSLKVSRAMFLGYRGKCALLAHVVLRGNEVAGRAALLAILAVVLRPCYAASYLAASYVAHILVLLLAGSPTSAWESAILAWPILFANLPQFVDSPKHGAAAQSVASLVCGLRALELAMAASATTAIVLLESAVDDWGEEGLLEVIDALRTLCHRRALLGLGLCLLLHYLCMLARWCGGQPEAAACGEGGASLESSPTGTRRGSPGATSVMRTSGSDSDLGDEKAFWPPALGVSQLLWGAACQRAVTIPQFIGSHGWRMSMGTGPGPPPRGGHPGGGVSGGALLSSVGGAVSSTRRPLEELNQPRLQDFDMIRIIGCGEFGQVCQVRWRATQETFAMKRLSKLEYARRRISDNAKREVATLRAASGHPFVVELFFAIESVSEWAIVMEYCPLGDLQQVLLSEGCPGLELARILKISAELTLALEHLHERGIAFRDLKLENVVVGQDGHVKLTDFGLAKQQEGGPDAISEAHEHGGVYAAFTRTFCGSYGYTAPEVSLRRQVHGFAADMYSFGVLILMLLTGGEVQHFAQGPPWESRLPPETPTQLKAILDRLSFDFYWAAHFLLRPAKSAHRVEVNLRGDVVVASRRARGTRRQARPGRPPCTPDPEYEPQDEGPASNDTLEVPLMELEAMAAELQASFGRSSGTTYYAAGTSSSASSPMNRPSRPSRGLRAVHFPRDPVASGGLRPFPRDFPDTALSDSEPSRRRWSCAVGLVRALVDEHPGRRGTVRTLKRHPFFAEEIPDWRLIYPRSWLRERLVSELRLKVGGSWPRGLAELLEALSAEELVSLLGNQAGQAELLARFREPGLLEHPTPIIGASITPSADFGAFRAGAVAAPPSAPGASASSSREQGGEERHAWVANYP